MVLICYMILQDHENKASSNFMCGSRSRQVSILPNLVAIKIVVVEI